MDAKSISMYTSAGSISEQDLFFISKSNCNSSYSSNKIDYGTLKESLVSASIDGVSSHFNFNGISDFRNQLSGGIYALSCGNVTIGGTKTFSKTPKVQNQNIEDIPDNGLVTKGAIEDIVAEKQVYVGSESKIDFNPRNSEGFTFNSENQGMLRWKIGSGMNDSSEYIPEGGSVPVGPVVCQEDGLLVCYGWIADNGDETPDNCWVALFGEIKTKENDDTYEPNYVAIQVQPWIIGQNAQKAQYVCFTVPVRRGLKLKIKTGFMVNGNPGWFGDRNSMMLSDGSSINMFVGYIIH